MPGIRKETKEENMKRKEMVKKWQLKSGNTEEKILNWRRFNHRSFRCLSLNTSQTVRRKFCFWLTLILKHRAFSTVQLTDGEESTYETALWKCEKSFTSHEK